MIRFVTLRTGLWWGLFKRRTVRRWGFERRPWRVR